MVREVKAGTLRLQVVPQNAGKHHGGTGPFRVYTFADRPSLASAEHMTGEAKIDDSKVVAHCMTVFGLLQAEALSGDRSLGLLEEASMSEQNWHTSATALAAGTVEVAGATTRSDTQNRRPAPISTRRSGPRLLSPSVIQSTSEPPRQGLRAGSSSDQSRLPPPSRSRETPPNPRNPWTCRPRPGATQVARHHRCMWMRPCPIGFGSVATFDDGFRTVRDGKSSRRAPCSSPPPSGRPAQHYP